MQLHCFGTAGYHPNEGRHTSAYFLPESNIALDAGSGFFRLEKHIQQDSIDILISHAHLDHVMGLTYLLDASFREKISKIRIWGEEEKVNAIQDHLFNPLLFPARLDAEWNTIKSGDQWEIRGMQLTCKEQEHPVDHSLTALTGPTAVDWFMQRIPQVTQAKPTRSGVVKQIS